MKYESLVIEKKEFVLLKRMLNLMGYYRDNTMRDSVKKLLEELETAQILDENEMPEDVVRFYSTMTIVSQNGWERRLTLVPPSEGDLKNGNMSVLTPMGTAIIGYAEGDSPLWEFPSGQQRLTIKDIEQENRLINANMIL